MRFQYTLLALLLIWVLAACQQQARQLEEPAPDAAVALLNRYGWVPRETLQEQHVLIPAAGGPAPFSSYYEASRALKLDFSSFVGQTLPLRSYLLGLESQSRSKVYAYVLMHGSEPVGAWMAVERERGGASPLNNERIRLLP